MKNPYLRAAAGTLLVVAAALLSWRIFGGSAASNPSAIAPLPAPPKADQPVRVRESLVPGKTYQTHAKGTVFFRGRDKAWGVEAVVTINYGFESKVDREVESNDGTRIVERRHFRDIRSLKLESTVEDLRLNLADDHFLIALAFREPRAAGILYFLQKADLKAVLENLPWTGVSPEKLIGLDEKAKGFAQIDKMTGKSCRITYVDGEGVVEIEDLVGTLDPGERDLVRASVLVTDSLIFPDEQVAEGKSWDVSGRALADLIDPSLRAYTSGKFIVQRKRDHVVDGKNCVKLAINDGRIEFNGSTPSEGRVGHFDPSGSLDFSLDDKAIIRANVKGSASFERFSKNHLLFETRSNQSPKLHLLYRCTVVDTSKTR